MYFNDLFHLHIDILEIQEQTSPQKLLESCISEKQDKVLLS